MRTKIEAYIRKHQMIRAGDHICAGVSGGADSVCLLLILEQLRETFGFSLSVVHIEHGIRGGESVLDMEFVKDLAGAHGIPFQAYAYPVEKLAKEQGCSIEEAGRNARYEAFSREAERYGAHTKIALAHHANDNAETMLFHLCRGSGIDGLAGIRPMRGEIIRPLLCVTRAEIEAFLKEAGQAYRTDATNADIAYSRNRIRTCVLPQMEQINAKAVQHMNRMAEEAAELSAYLCGETERILANHTTRVSGREIRFSLAGFMEYPAILRGRVMLALLAELSGSKKDLSREHSEALQGLAAGQTGKKLILPYGIVAEKSYEELRFFADKEAKEQPISHGTMQYRVFECPKKDRKIPQNLYTKWFDYDKIKNRLKLRTREPGDYFVVDGAGHRQRLKDYWINEKVPRAERDRILLLADGSHVLWAVGYRISEYYKITEQTTKVLEAQYTEERK